MSAEPSNKPVHALLNAVATSKLRLVRLLIEGGVNVDTRNDRGQTPLLITCSTLKDTSHIRGETRERVVKYLITAGADVNAYDATGRTPLIYAVITRAQSSVVFDLIEAGADPWREDRSRKCAFDYALQQRDIVHVQVIVDAYKRRKIREAGTARNARDSRETSSVHEPIKDTPRADKIQPNNKSGSKSAKNKQETGKKTKIYPTNRKRPSRRISLMALGRNKNAKNISSRNPKRSSLYQVSRSKPKNDKNDNIIASDNFPDNPSVITQSPRDPQESTSSPTYPTQSTNVQQLHENTQLCGLCKTILSDRNEAKISDPPCATSSTENLGPSFSEYDFSGLLYRRRSTGSLFGLTEKRYESIRKKRELGITMEDIFSSTEINQPGEQSLYVKSSRTNTLVDISANELLVPDPSRARSMSVSLPPLDDVRHMLRVGDYMNMLCSRDQAIGFGEPFLKSARSVSPVHTMAMSPTGGMVFNPESCVYLSSDDDCDDILIIPASYRSTTSSPDDDTTSQRDVNVTSRQRSPSSGVVGNEERESSEACGSPIPTIVLTDY